MTKPTSLRDRSGVDRLVAQAIADADQTPARALLLAAAAYDVDPSPATAGAMQSAIVAQPAGFAGFIPTSWRDQPGADRRVGDRAAHLRQRRDHRSVEPNRARRDPRSDDEHSGRAERRRRVVALAGPTVRVYESADGSLLAELEPSVRGDRCRLRPDRRSRLAVGYDDGTAEIVAWETGTVAATLATQGDLVRVIAFSPDGRHVATATGSRESAVRIWDAATGLPTTATSAWSGRRCITPTSPSTARNPVRPASTAAASDVCGRFPTALQWDGRRGPTAWSRSIHWSSRATT